MKDTTLWTVEGVRLGDPPRWRLDQVSLAIPDGITAVIGPSGAGKSSLLNLLVGFETPYSGRVVPHLCSRPDGAQRLPLYWVPQDFGLWNHLTARQHLRTVCGDVDDNETSRILAELGLHGKEEQLPDALSRGECSRLAVARALATSAAVLVMDEPLASVDLAGQRQCLDVILRHLEATGSSLVLATHAPEQVVGVAGHVICLEEGSALWAGSADTLYHRPPSRRLADCLGPGNWFEAGEARLWLGRDEPEPWCVRPEQLAVVADDDSDLVVRSARCRGAVAEVELEHRACGKRRRFYHRPPGSGERALSAGLRVGLQLQVILLLLLALLGCGREQVPILPVQSVQIWQIPPDGRTVPAPRSLHVTADDEVVVLDNAGRVLVLDRRGALLRQWRMPETEAGSPEGVCTLADGRIVICDTHYHRVVIFSRDGEILDTFGDYGTAPGQMIYPVGVTTDPDGYLYICEYGANDRVQKLTVAGQFVLQLGTFGTGSGQLQRPSGLAWIDGRIYVADAVNNRIEVYDSSDGRYLQSLGQRDGMPALRLPYDLAISGAGRSLLVVEYGAGRVSEIGLDGRLYGRFGRTGSAAGELATPWGICSDRRGHLLVADTGNRRIVELVL